MYSYRVETGRRLKSDFASCEIWKMQAVGNQIYARQKVAQAVCLGAVTATKTTADD